MTRAWLRRLPATVGVARRRSPVSALIVALLIASCSGQAPKLDVVASEPQIPPPDEVEACSVLAWADRYWGPPLVRIPDPVGARQINADPHGDRQRALDECHRHCLRFAHSSRGEIAVDDDASQVAARAGAGWEPCDVIKEAAEWSSAIQ